MNLDLDFIFNLFDDCVRTGLSRNYDIQISDESEITAAAAEESPSFGNKLLTNNKEKKIIVYQNQKDVVSSTKSG